jgi:hypothetical protein
MLTVGKRGEGGAHEGERPAVECVERAAGCEKQ